MSFYTSLSGLKGAQSDLSVISNNIANVGSIGFKKSRAEFGDLISASPLQSGTVAGQGTRLKDISQQFTQGGFQTSDRALDLAISGQGFFVTKTGSQLSYTRDGAFSLDGDRYLVDGNGAYAGQITLPSDSKDTTISLVNSSGQTVYSKDLGPKAQGDVAWSWDGKDTAGNATTDGALQVIVSSTGTDGKSQSPTQATWNEIQSVKSPATGTTQLITGLGGIDPSDVLQLS